jgi:hypothetical protein
MITHDARRSLPRGNNPVPSPRLATAFTTFETHELIEASDLAQIAERAKRISYQPPGTRQERPVPAQFALTGATLVSGLAARKEGDQ